MTPDIRAQAEALLALRRLVKGPYLVVSNGRKYAVARQEGKQMITILETDQREIAEVTAALRNDALPVIRALLEQVEWFGKRCNWYNEELDKQKAALTRAERMWDAGLYSGEALADQVRSLQDTNTFLNEKIAQQQARIAALEADNESLKARLTDGDMGILEHRRVISNLESDLARLRAERDIWRDIARHWAKMLPILSEIHPDCPDGWPDPTPAEIAARVAQNRKEQSRGEQR